jgi:hypothetical protein
MAPKKVAQVEKAAEKASKVNKRKAAAVEDAPAPVVPDGDAVSKGDGDKVDRAACSGMLTLLKYRSDPEKNRKGTLLSESQKALEVYKALPDGKKPQFIRDYEANKKSGNMNFVNTYKETVENVKEDTNTLLDQMLNRAQILRANGLDPKDYNDAKQEKLLEHLLSEAEAKFEYSRTVNENKDLPELSKYRYIVDQGRKIEKKRKETDSFNINGTVSGKALENMMSGSSASGEAVVKVENPLSPKLKEIMTALKSAKSLLEKKYNEGSDLYATCVGVKEHEEKTAVKQYAPALKLVNTFIDELRLFIAVMDKVKVPDVLQSHVDDAEKKKALAVVHVDSFKEKTRHLKAVL